MPMSVDADGGGGQAAAASWEADALFQAAGAKPSKRKIIKRAQPKSHCHKVCLKLHGDRWWRAGGCGQRQSYARCLKRRAWTRAGQPCAPAAQV